MQAARDESDGGIRSKSRFLAAASHDLRQPLHAMTLFVSALSRRLSGGESGELVGNLDSSLRSLRAMIDTLLDIFQTRRRPGQAVAGRRGVERPVRRAPAGLQPVARDRGLAYRVVPTAAMVVGDRTWSSWRCANLIANAFKFTRGGGVLVGCRRRRGRIGIAVADPASASPPTGRRACSRSSIATRRRQRPQRGIGLGLSIVQRLAALMGGSVELRSRPGKGSVFTLWLREAAQAPRPARRVIAPRARSPAAASSFSTTTR